MAKTDFQFDFAGADKLADALRLIALVLDDQERARTGAARLPLQEWRGIFAQEFTEMRLRVCLADTRSLAEAFRNAATALNTLSDAARQEKLAVEWRVAQMKGEAAGGPAPKSHEPPTYRAKSSVARERGAPSWGSLLIRPLYDKSSAVPEHLETYVKSSRDLNKSLKHQGQALSKLFDEVAPGLGWGGSHFDIGWTLDDLSRFAHLNDDDDRWVGAIAQAFRQAGGGGLVTLADQGIGDELTKQYYSKESLANILEKYQVAEDEMVDWPGSPWSYLRKPVHMTRTEAKLLEQLALSNGFSPLDALDAFEGIKKKAMTEATKQYGPGNKDWPSRLKAGQDGYQDAFKHAYWSALLTQRFGYDFARAFTVAHEGPPGNPADREAMDLYNDKVGADIAKDHPDASQHELAALVKKALEHGDLVVIDGQHELAYSNLNQVPLTTVDKSDDLPRRRSGRPAADGGGRGD